MSLEWRLFLTCLTAIACTLWLGLGLAWCAYRRWVGLLAVESLTDPEVPQVHPPLPPLSVPPQSRRVRRRRERQGRQTIETLVRFPDEPDFSL